MTTAAALMGQMQSKGGTQGLHAAIHLSLYNKPFEQ